MNTSPSARALDAWCDAQRGRAASLAKALGVTATTVHNWRRGAIIPRSADPDNRAELERLTDGAVPAAGWEPPAPAEVVVDRGPEFSQTAGEAA